MGQRRQNTRFGTVGTCCSPCRLCVEKGVLGTVLLLIVGCFLDPNSAILVLTPLLLPVMQAIGVDPIHFGIIMTVNLAIGMFTPPFGLNIFVAQALFKAPLSSIYPGLVPFIVINIIALMLVTYVPELSLFLTR